MTSIKKHLSVLFFLGTGLLIILGVSGFKLEKNARQLTETESVKAPTEEEAKKVKEGPPSPSYKMDSFDDFMTEGPIRKVTPLSSVKTKSASRKQSRMR